MQSLLDLWDRQSFKPACQRDEEESIERCHDQLIQEDTFDEAPEAEASVGFGFGVGMGKGLGI